MAGRHFIVHFCPLAKPEALRQGDTPASLEVPIIVSNEFCLSHTIKSRFYPKGTVFPHFYLLSPSPPAYLCHWSASADTLSPCVVYVQVGEKGWETVREKERKRVGQGVIYTLYFNLLIDYRACCASHYTFLLTRQYRIVLGPFSKVIWMYHTMKRVTFIHRTVQVN